MAEVACEMPFDRNGSSRPVGDVKRTAGTDYEADKWVHGCSFQDVYVEEYLKVGLPTNVGAGEGVPTTSTSRT